MHRITRRWPSPATVISLIALFVALGGTSYAISKLPKNSVGSAQVVNGSLQKVDLSRRAVTALKGNRGRQGPAGAQGAAGVAGPVGATGAAGAQGATGSQGTQGVPGTARAYGRVARDGTLTRSKNVAGVTHPELGRYCIAFAAGIDVTQTGLMVTPDLNGDDTDVGTNAEQAIVEWNSAGSCPVGQLEVSTAVRFEVTTGSPDGDLRSVNNTPDDEPFFFILP